MTQLAARRIRLAVDPYVQTDTNDLLTSKLPRIWRGANTVIEVGLYQNGVWVTDISNIAQLIMEVHSTIRLSAALTSKTLATASLVSCSLADWTTNAADKYHGRFLLQAAETQYEMPDNSAQVTTFWLVFHALTIDQYKITLGGTQLTVEEDGVENGIPAIGNASDPLWNITGNDLQLWNETQGKYQTIYLSGAVGQETLVIGAI